MQRLLPLLWLSVACFLGLAPLAGAQNQRSSPVKAIIGSGIIRLGQTTKISIEVQDATVADIVKLPQVDGLRIGPVGGPSSSTFTRIYNGRAHRKITLSWDVLVTPERVGEFVIPPIEMVVEGKAVITDDFTLRVVLDTKGEELGFVELVNPPTRIYEGQPFTLDLRFGWDQEFTVHSVNLRLPWWNQLPGTLELDSLDPRGGRPVAEIVVNGRYKVQAEHLDTIERDGRVFNQFRVARRFLASRPGTLELPGSSFEFARILRRGGFGRPDEAEEYFVQLAGHSIEVLPVPETGQPPSWTGAVGNLAVTRRVDRRDVDAGDSIKLTVAWSGTGNLEFFDAPDPGRMDSFSGFRLLGTQDRYSSGVRQVTYDLVPTSAETEEIPPVSLWTFDPELDGYREVLTEPVPIRVRRLEGASGLESEGEEASTAIDIRDIRPHAVPEASSLRRPGAKVLVAALPLVLVGWVLGRRSVRRRGHPDSPIERARRRARRELARGLSRADGPEDQQRALYDYLAARSREAREAWVGRDPEESAAVAGLEPDQPALVELHRQLEQLDRSLYAGSADRLEPSRVLDVVDRLRKEGL